MADWTIAGLAREGGVGVETIRYYQRRGLMPLPERVPGPGGAGGIRRYGEADVRRLRFIRSAQGAGFTLEQIGELLALDATDDRARVRELAKTRIAALDAQIAELQKARGSLAQLAGECGSGTDGPCPILVSFEQATDPPRHGEGDRREAVVEGGAPQRTSCAEAPLRQGFALPPPRTGED